LVVGDPILILNDLGHGHSSSLVITAPRSYTPKDPIITPPEADVDHRIDSVRLLPCAILSTYRHMTPTAGKTLHDHLWTHPERTPDGTSGQRYFAPSIPGCRRSAGRPKPGRDAGQGQQLPRRVAVSERTSLARCRLQPHRIQEPHRMPGLRRQAHPARGQRSRHPAPRRRRTAEGSESGHHALPVLEQEGRAAL